MFRRQAQRNAVALAGFLASSALASPLATVDRRVAIMGTTVDVSVVASSREEGLAASESAIAAMRRVENLLTTWRQSPLLELNHSRVGEPIPLDAELSSVLAEVLAWSARTDRAFDPTVAPLVQAWDLRGRGRIPSPEELAAALAATGAGRFRLDPAGGTALRLDPLAGIDEGAWGKGYALDRAADRLAAAGAENALIDLGGQVLARGRDASRQSWTIAIAHPRDRVRPVVTLRLSNASASTSGNSERSRDVAGRRIGHLLDPRTGEPAEDFGSVTVVAASGLDADVLSTAFFVLGPEKGLALSDRLRREGLANEALFLVVRGDALEARSSPGCHELVLGADPELVHGLSATSRKAP